MKINKKEKIITFNCDDDFSTFAIGNCYSIKNSEKNQNMKYFDIDYTDEYLNYLKDGYMFIIRGKSLVAKRQAVSFGVITKDVENVICEKDYIK